MDSKRLKPRKLALQAMEYITSTDHVLDVGCGKGNESFLFVQYAKKVTAIDKDTRIIELRKKSRENAQDLVIIKDDFTRMIFPECTVFYSSYSLSHCPPEQFPSMWKNIEDCIQPSGTLCIHLLGKQDFLYPEHNYSFFGKEEVQLLLSKFTVISLKSIEYKDEMHQPRQIYTVIAKKM